MTRRRAARKAKRAVRKSARVAKRTTRKAARVARRQARKSGPAEPQGLADMTEAPGMKTAAGGPSLNDIGQGAEEAPERPTPRTSGGLSGIQNDPFKAAQQTKDFGEPQDEPQEEPAEEEPQEPEAEAESEDYDNIIGAAIGGIGQAVGGILKGLNINTGARKKAASDAQLAAFQARAAAAQAAAAPKKSNTGLYIGIGAGVLVLVIIVIFVMKKK